MFTSQSKANATTTRVALHPVASTLQTFLSRPHTFRGGLHGSVVKSLMTQNNISLHLSLWARFGRRQLLFYGPSHFLRFPRDNHSYKHWGCMWAFTVPLTIRKRSIGKAPHVLVLVANGRVVVVGIVGNSLLYYQQLS